MCKVKNEEVRIYGTIEEAIYEKMNEHIAVQKDNITIYNAGALEAVCTFLCLNQIHHEYTITSSTNRKPATDLVSLIFQEEEGTMKSINWMAYSEEQYLVQFSDESGIYIIEGCALMGKEEFKTWMDTLIDVCEYIDTKKKTLEFWYSDSNWLPYELSTELFERFTVTQLTHEECTILKRLLFKGGLQVIGQFMTTDFLVDVLSDWKNDDGAKRKRIEACLKKHLGVE